MKGNEVERSVQLSCGEHTDYGLLTLVNQDAHITALQVWNVQCMMLALYHFNLETTKGCITSILKTNQMS